MTILITGGTGLLGRETARQLLERGNDVALFDIIPRENMWGDIKDRVTYIRGDLSNWSSVLNAVQEVKCESIIHLGAMLSSQCEADPWSAYKVNVDGTKNTLEAARLYDVGRLVFSSSIATVMCPEVTDVLTDTSLQRPRLLYGVTKLFGELLGRYYSAKFGLDFRALRFTTVIGPGVKSMGLAQCLPWSVEHALKGISYDLWLAPEVGMDVIYYKDAARALIILHDAPRENISTMCYNVSGNTIPRIEDFVRIVKEIIQHADIGFKPDPEINRLIGEGYPPVDDSRAREEWGWAVKYQTGDMIRDFIEEYTTKKMLYE